MLQYSKLSAASFVLCLIGCGSNSTSYDREFDLTLRAAFDRITEAEKQQLFQENHPILLQMADPALLDLLRLFAELPSKLHSELHQKLFLKWRFAELDRHRQMVFEQVLRMNMGMLGDHAKIAEADRVIGLLRQCDVGFAVVEIPSTGEKVISCFVMWPEHLFPTWVTVANAKASQNQDAIAAHIARLPMLKTLSHSELPPAINTETALPHKTASESNGNSVRNLILAVHGMLNTSYGEFDDRRC